MLYLKTTKEANLSVSSPLSENPAFEKFFLNIYGDRWDAVRKSLTEAPMQILRQNRFVQEDVQGGRQSISWLPHCFWKPEEFYLQKNESGYFTEYVMDPASVIVALSLDVQSCDRVLDMCAAPGGKTLVLAEQMNRLGETSGSLTSNELSKDRRERLSRVLQDYIPKDKRLFITVKGLDGNQYGLRWPETYDRVLADVPCSGERHLLQNAAEYALWSEKRTKNLSVRQYSLLSSAWLAVKVGGRIVYSTCSISPLENDDVVAKLVKKRKVGILRPEWLKGMDFIEETAYGYRILPDKGGFGPMYFAVIQKN